MNVAHQTLDGARWHAVLTAAQDAIICIDEAGSVTLFNPAAERMFGYAAAEVIGRDVARLMPSPYADEHAVYIRRYRETGVAKAIGRLRSVEAKNRDGTVFPIELSVSEVMHDGRATYTAIIRDITDQLRAKQRLIELEQSSRQTDRLADIGAITAKVVHDLGNPLAALTMQAQLILRRARRGDISPYEFVERPVAQMLETLERLEALVREFTDFARDRHLQIHAIRLPEYLVNIADLWSAYASARAISLRTSTGPDLPVLCADREMFRRVLDNVIKNAIDAISGDSGEVLLQAVRHGPDQIRISVYDDGCGIPNEIDVFRLFETTKPEGTGIGLAVAKQIVVAHGGAIHHEKRSPKGTVFHIDLPLAGPEIA